MKHGLKLGLDISRSTSEIATIETLKTFMGTSIPLVLGNLRYYAWMYKKIHLHLPLTSLLEYSQWHLVFVEIAALFIHPRTDTEGHMD